MDVEQLAALFLAVALQEGLDDRVALGALEGRGAVDVVKALGTFLLYRHQSMWLACAADAAAGAGHALRQVVVGLAAAGGAADHTGTKAKPPGPPPITTTYRWLMDSFSSKSLLLN